MTAALYWQPLPEGGVRCALCPHRCRLREAQRGLCGVRLCRENALWTETWGRVTALALDPIEKKPLRHFLPGSRILSVGGAGCNMRCAFCQNHSIAQGTPATRPLAPDELAAMSLELRDQGNVGVAYTYNEPLVGYEYVRDCARLVRAQGQRNALVTNGMICAEPLEELLEYVDALNIDVKCFTEEGYHLLGGSLPDVRRTVATAAARCHVEVTTLVVPGLSDSEAQMRALAVWLASIDPAIPLHVSRYFPRHHMREPATPVATVYQLAQAARAHLQHVYEGNC